MQIAKDPLKHWGICLWQKFVWNCLACANCTPQNNLLQTALVWLSARAVTQLPRPGHTYVTLRWLSGGSFFPAAIKRNPLCMKLCFALESQLITQFARNGLMK
jgi:hypothetical protein